MWRGCLLIFLLSACRAEPVPVALISGMVIKVSDGDSLLMRDDQNQEHQLRLAFIDAPEYSQPFGSEARRNLDRLIYRQRVQAQVVDTDRYQRSVVVLHLGNADINSEQIKAGFAWHYQHFARGKQSTADYEYYQRLEQQARQARIGLWQDARPVPPWDDRKAHRVAN
ncbi:thermonuclease family protein [Iodobacter fluviatilis]|uniref:Thermonuclease n=1 Tax=Iodobacter fluviatilis TaxID=537 RepID=A0A377Q324_9NEIS|nr:thermonuclease family protein [Iodobacter fluviatilis]TCU90190.1 endonuclease YncB(thermonuclease family) [Iodobacter fluviatilis]STQ89217.1 Thermonuclease precursor [Iodobacter fluviatilis]